MSTPLLPRIQHFLYEQTLVLSSRLIGTVSFLEAVFLMLLVPRIATVPARGLKKA